MTHSRVYWLTCICSMLLFASIAGATTIVLPTDDQLIKPAFQGPHWGLRGIAQRKQAVLIVPEYWYDVPIFTRESREGSRGTRADVSGIPALRIQKLQAWAINATATAGVLQTRAPATVWDNVGSLARSADNDWAMTINAESFRAGVLRGGYGANDAIVAAVMNGAKK